MTGIPLSGKVVDLVQLQTEMVTAGIDVPSLGTMAGALITYDQHGAPADLPPAAAPVLAAHVPNTALQDQLTTALQSTVGVALSALTQAQRLALVAGLLYKAGAIDHQTLAVRPLSTWLL